MMMRRELNLYISGDDKVVATNKETVEKIARSTHYWQESGLLRKGKEIDKPSRP